MKKLIFVLLIAIQAVSCTKDDSKDIVSEPPNGPTVITPSATYYASQILEDLNGLYEFGVMNVEGENEIGDLIGSVINNNTKSIQFSNGDRIHGIIKAHNDAIEFYRWTESSGSKTSILSKDDLPGSLKSIDNFETVRSITLFKETPISISAKIYHNQHRGITASYQSICGDWVASAPSGTNILVVRSNGKLNRATIGSKLVGGGCHYDISIIGYDVTNESNIFNDEELVTLYKDIQD